MASCQTTQWVSTSPYVKLTVTQSASTETTATLSYTLQYVASYAANTNGVGRAYTIKIGSQTITGTYDIDGVTGTKTIKSGTVVITKTTAKQTVSFSVSFAFNVTWSGSYKGTLSASSSISVAAKTSYAVKYNANGGSGAPSAQTKWHGTALTLSSTKPTRTGYTFQGWATSSSGSVAYAAGASYSANAAVTFYAVWKAITYTVSYNANGGSGAPSAQTKTYGTALTLSSAKPTRTNYTFKGWGTSASATAVSYAAGASYTTNAAITLYAIWELAYTKPRISDLSIERCDSGGTVADDGTYALVTFDWECDKSVSAITIKWKLTDSNTWKSASATASGTSGTVNHVAGDSTLTGILDVESSYDFHITVTDSGGSSYATGMLPSMSFPIDFMAGGKGAAMNKAAELEGVFDIGFQTRHLGGILSPVLEPDTDLNNILIPNTYVGDNISNYNYANCPVTSGTFTLVVESCGEAGQVKQTYCSCSKYKPERYSRFYYQGAWGAWFWANTDEYILYENDSGTPDAITLNASVDHFRYIEIYCVDNNGKAGGYAKVYKPSGKTVGIQMTEAASNVYYRQTAYVISGTKITPDITNASYVRVNSSGVVSIVQGTNYLRIVRVIGRA